MRAWAAANCRSDKNTTDYFCAHMRVRPDNFTSQISLLYSELNLNPAKTSHMELEMKIADLVETRKNIIDVEHDHLGISLIDIEYED